MSTLRVNNITDTSGGSSSLSVPGAAKAWVNFNGTGTVAIRAQMNVSSITDNGVGDYTVNFTTALADANYTAVISIGASSGNPTGTYVGQIYTNASVPATGSVRVRASWGSINEDITYMYVAIFR